jgi:GPR1/FUN34/yaaH family
MSTLRDDVEKGGRSHHEYPSSGPNYVANGTGGTRLIANPGPLGLSAFALTTFVLSLVSPTYDNIFDEFTHTVIDQLVC